MLSLRDRLEHDQLEWNKMVGLGASDLDVHTPLAKAVAVKKVMCDYSREEAECGAGVWCV